MAWQDRFRELGEQLTSGQITTEEYRRRSEAILTEADREADSEAAETTAETTTGTTAEAATETAAETQPRDRVPIPASAAWEAPSGEMTQIVGTRDETTVVNPIRDALDGDPGPEN